MPLKIAAGEVAELPRRRRGPGRLTPLARLVLALALGVAALAFVGWLYGAR